MRNTATLFIDESGKSSLVEQADNPFLITGVILNDGESKTIEGYFNYIKLKFGIDPNKPFHSYHIYEHPNHKLSNSQLLSLSAHLADYISLIPISINISYVNKQIFKNAIGVTSENDFKGSSERKEMKNFPYRVLAALHFALFGMYLQKNDCVGQIIADSRRGGDHQLLKTLDLCKEKQVPFSAAHLEAINKKVTAICFAEKGFLSGGLEITDLISFVTYFRVRRLISTQKDIGLDLIWEQIRLKAKNISSL